MLSKLGSRSLITVYTILSALFHSEGTAVRHSTCVSTIVFKNVEFIIAEPCQLPVLLLITRSCYATFWPVVPTGRSSEGLRHRSPGSVRVFEVTFLLPQAAALHNFLCLSLLRLLLPFLLPATCAPGIVMLLC